MEVKIEDEDDGELENEVGLAMEGRAGKKKCSR